MLKTLTETEKIQEIVKNTNLRHIAIIMDGNRRWAKSKFLPSAAGHKKGVEALRATLKACAKFNIKYLHNNIIITLFYKNLEEHYIYYLVKLLLAIKDN